MDDVNGVHGGLIRFRVWSRWSSLWRPTTNIWLRYQERRHHRMWIPPYSISSTAGYAMA